MPKPVASSNDLFAGVPIMTEISETFEIHLVFEISALSSLNLGSSLFMKAWIIVTSFKQLLLIEVLFTQYMR